MSYPSCKHGFDDPNGAFPACANEERVEQLERELAEAHKALEEANTEREGWRTQYHELLNSVPVDDIKNTLTERDTMRSVLETCSEALATAARLPVARAYPDGPCMDKADHDEIVQALALANRTLGKD